MRPRVLVLTLASAVSLPFLINFCHLVYQCGCRSLWNGAAATCNIHNASNHDCPWCETGILGMVVPPLMILLAMAAVVSWPGAFRPWRRLTLALAMFPLAGGLAALLFGLATRYWS
jgi:hypothetical protein